MHGFNTFEIDSFQYPNQCARCAKNNEASVPWRLVQRTIEFPDGPPTGEYGEHRNYNDFVTDVPICKTCHQALASQERVCFLLGGVAGAVTAFSLFRPMVDAGLTLFGVYLCAGAAGIVVAIALGWIVKLIAVDCCTFARLNGVEQTIKFKNKDYQAAFDRLNCVMPQQQMSRAW